MRESTTVRIGDIEIAYDDAGAGGRPLVLVHGFTGSRDDWREVLPELARRGRTIAPDLRGHGESTNLGDPEAYSFERLGDDLAGFLDALGIERCDLLGHSLGGIICLRLALAQPERVASLVLMDTSAAPLRARTREAFEAAGRLVRAAGMEALYEVLRAEAEQVPERAAALRHEIAVLGEAAFWERLRVKLEAMDPEAFAVLGPELVDHEPVTDRLGEIDVPTLVLVGADDEPFLEPAEELERGIRGARRVVIADAAHSPQVAQPEAWLAAVLEHLERAG